MASFTCIPAQLNYVNVVCVCVVVYRACLNRKMKILVEIHCKDYSCTLFNNKAVIEVWPSFGNCSKGGQNICLKKKGGAGRGGKIFTLVYNDTKLLTYGKKRIEE